MKRLISRAAACVTMIATIASAGPRGAACASTGSSPDSETSPGLTIEATTSFGWTLHEQVENGLVQSGSSDPADDVASGFVFTQGRIGLRYAADGERSRVWFASASKSGPTFSTSGECTGLPGRSRSPSGR